MQLITLSKKFYPASLWQNLTDNSYKFNKYKNLENLIPNFL